jgi:hypothetical protein
MDETIKKEYINSFIKLMTLSSFYFVIVDRDLNIIVANKKVEETILGKCACTEVNLIGKSWINFVSNDDQMLAKTAYTSIFRFKGDLESPEITYSIKTPDCSTLPICWVTSYIDTNIDWTISIGTKTRSVNLGISNEESIREYYRNLIDKDKKMIDIVREVTSKYSNMILKKGKKDESERMPDVQSYENGLD